MSRDLSSVRSEIFVAVGFNPRLGEHNEFQAPFGVTQYRSENMSLRWSLTLVVEPPPPVETGGYKDFAPPERGAEGLMNGTERPRYPDLSLGRSTFN